MAETQDQKPSVVLHWLERSRSQRVVWLLEECKDLPYSIEIYKRGSDQLAPASLKKVHPLGKSPTVTVQIPNQAQPIVLAESAAIFEYLSGYFAQHLVPKRYKDGQEDKIGGETEQWVRYRFYMHYAEGSLMAMLLIAYLMDQIKNGKDVPFFIKPITRAIATKIEDAFLTGNLKTQFAFLESQLASSPDGGEYLCGKDLTGADILLSFPLIAGKDRIPASAYPKLAAYIQKLETHPGYVGSVRKIEDLTGEQYKGL